MTASSPSTTSRISSEETGFAFSSTCASTSDPSASVTLGKVTAVDDPDGCGRVRVTLPAHGDLDAGWGHEFFGEGATSFAMGSANVLTIVDDPSGIFGPFMLAERVAALKIETDKLEQLLASNTTLTRQDKELTEQIAALTREIHSHITQS